MHGLKPYSYDRDRFAPVLDYDRYSLILDGRRVFLFGGEFHYWRVPDRDRWRDLLAGFKTGGLNCVRVYFHWGWHSPVEGRTLFEGNRDLEALFQLCEELGLYVLCAPGPYICAETSAGGFPAWLLARREVRLRHVSRTGFKKYDPEFARLSRQWFREFIPIMSRHERTTHPRGCVIGMQIENELFRKRLLRLGLDRQMEDLARDAREFGATVPIFHNDAFLFGSWVGGRDPRAAAVDLYGFDAYIVWCPQRTFGKRGEPPQWKDRGFARRIDSKERAFRGFGGWNLQTPLLIPELQGGWFNQWGLDHGFDEIYEFYGDDYTKAVVESFLAQGMSMFSLYMYYGGTNWGTLGDPDVYTSYDYSACIREYGYLSDRLRKLRLTRLLIRSFEEDLLESDAVEPMGLRCSLKNLLIRHRRSRSGVDFYYLRNFNPDRKTGFELSRPDGALRAMGTLRYRASFIALGNVRIPGFSLELAAMPWLVRMRHREGELWVLQMNGGELLFQETGLAAFGQARATAHGPVTRVTFQAPGPGRLEAPDGKALYLLALDEHDALSLTADFESEELRQLAWGAYGLLFTRGRLEVETTRDSTVHHLGPRMPEGFEPDPQNLIPGMSSREFRTGPAPCPEPVSLGPWDRFPVRWDAPAFEKIWKPIDLSTGRDPLDHLYTSGHVVYRCRFSCGRGPLSLRLNIRHRALVWLNGRCAGGHVTYGLKILQAGAKNGPDPSWRGGVRYDLSPHLRPGESNTLIVLVDNLGYNRGPGVLNDFRNPRGILSAGFSPRVEPEQWEIAGIDVRTLDDVFNTAGLLGEGLGLHEGRGEGWIAMDGPPAPAPDHGLVWYRTSFAWKKEESIRLPLRAHLEGRHSVQLFVNGLYLGRYAGDLGPQHDFYLPDGVLRDGRNTVVLAVCTCSQDPLVFRIQPYRIDPASGNLDETGPVFCTRREVVPL